MNSKKNSQYGIILAVVRQVNKVKYVVFDGKDSIRPLDLLCNKAGNRLRVCLRHGIVGKEQYFREIRCSELRMLC